MNASRTSWTDIVETRNILVHEYFGVDTDIATSTARSIKSDRLTQRSGQTRLDQWVYPVLTFSRAVSSRRGARRD